MISGTTNYDFTFDHAGKITDFDFWYDGNWYRTDTATGDPIKYDDTGQLTDGDYQNDWQTDETRKGVGSLFGKDPLQIGDQNRP